MNTAILETEHGLQVRSGAARGAHADRVHRQPGAIVPTGRNSFELAVRQGNARWEDTYVTAEAAAAYLGLTSTKMLGAHIARCELTPYRRKGCERRLFRRADVEALVQPDTGKLEPRGAAANAS